MSIHEDARKMKLVAPYLAASARTSSVTLYSGVTVKSVMLLDT